MTADGGSVGLRGRVISVVTVLTLGITMAGVPRARASTAVIVSGKLTVTGSSSGEKIRLRLAANPNILLVDDGAIGGVPPSHKFDRTLFSSISVDGGAGADLLVIDEANGVFTDTESTTIVGGAGKDTILGGSGNETIRGGLGNDSLKAGGGDFDRVEGEEGKDTLSGGGGSYDFVVQSVDGDQTLSATKLTGEGPDVHSAFERGQLIGGPSANQLTVTTFPGGVILSAGGEDDTLVGGPGDDALTGQVGDDSMTGGGGLDRLSEGSANSDIDFTLTDSSLSGLGTDTLSSIERAHVVGGPSGNTFDASSFTGDTNFEALGGSDNYLGGTGTDQVFQETDADMTLTNSSLSGLGTDSLSSVEEAYLQIDGITGRTLDATAFTGSDSLGGAGGGDTLLGGQGDSMLFGEGGDDSLNGGTGDTDVVSEFGSHDWTIVDTLLTGEGNDTLTDIESASLISGSGDDSLDASGFPGPVSMFGQGGNDTLIGGTGQAWLSGGIGNDSVTGGTMADTLHGDAGNDSVTGGAGADSMFGDAGRDTLAGGTEGDTIDGGSGRDSILGEDGDDSLLGGEGDDTLKGGPGTDTLAGGPGTDKLVQD